MARAGGTDRAPAGNLAALLAVHRTRAGLTQEQLSERSGVSVRAIGDVEGGRVRWPQRRTIAALVTTLGLADAERAEFLLAAKAGKVPAPSADRRIAPTPRAAQVSLLSTYVADVVGRDAELSVLTRWAVAAARIDAPACGTTVVLHGLPGTGKTSVALRLGQLVAARFPDGQLLLDLTDAGVDPLRGLPAAFGMADDDQGSATAEARYRSALDGRRLLLVLDGATGVDQVRPLLARQHRCLTLITSRDRLAGLADANRVGLGDLATAAARELLESVVGTDRVAREPAEATEVVELCGRLPLAVRIAGNRLVSRPSWPIAYLADQLRDRQRRLSVLGAGDGRVGSAFEASYARLTGDARLVFRRLGLAPTDEVDRGLAAALSGMDLSRAQDALETLVDSGLLTPTPGAGYTMNSLVRTFAGDLAGATDSADDVRRAEYRMIDWVFTTATASAADSPTGLPAGRGRSVLACAMKAVALGRHEDVVALAVALLPSLAPTPPDPHWGRLVTVAAASARVIHRPDVTDALRRLVDEGDTPS